MIHSQTPAFIPRPFADSGDRRTIPVLHADVVSPNQFSMEAGFPSVTRIPKQVGGIAPSGQDFNSALWMLSAANRWSQAGGLYQFNAGFATAVGGYPKGALLLGIDGATVWQSTAENNTIDPDGTSPAGWREFAPRPDSALRADLAATTANKGASLIGIEDAAGHFAAMTVEGALIEADTRLRAIETRQTSGTWTPTPVGFDITGTVAFSGRWARSGNLIAFTITATPSSGSSLNAAWSSSRLTGTPFVPLTDTAVTAAWLSGGQAPNGLMHAYSGDIRVAFNSAQTLETVWSGTVIVS